MRITPLDIQQKQVPVKFRGFDVEEVYAFLEVIREEMEELLALSDRIAVIYEGEIMGVVDGDDADVDEIGLMMTGTRGSGTHLAADEQMVSGGEVNENAN